jgi:hypothetical protein
MIIFIPYTSPLLSHSLTTIVSLAKSNSNRFFFALHMIPQRHRQSKCTSLFPPSYSSTTKPVYVDFTTGTILISQLPRIFLPPKQLPPSHRMIQPTTSTFWNTPSNESISTTCGISRFTSRKTGVVATRKHPGYGILDSRGNGQS